MPSIFTNQESLLRGLVQILLIVGLTLIVLRIADRLNQRIERRIARPEVDAQQQARLKTLLSAARYGIGFVVVLIAALMVLLVLGINVTPVLASVGVAGLAISLGAQSLIKDYVGGMLVLLEDQYRVGDVVEIGAYAGTVEEITLRYTRLRDLEGRMIYISNGDIRSVTRSGYDWSRVVVDLNIPYDADIGTVVQVLEAAMGQAKGDPEISADLLEAPVIQGWNSFSAWAVQVRLSAKTTPARRLDVANVLRRYALEALRAADIHVASPPVTL